MSHCATSASNCIKTNVWDDSAVVKRRLEARQRQLRIQQVREESKKLSRKLCREVANEKERQLYNLEMMKSKELDHWRKNVLAKKTDEYNCAISAVGDAHRCAEQEKKEEQYRKESQKKSTVHKSRHCPVLNKENTLPSKSNVIKPHVRCKKTVKVARKEEASVCHVSSSPPPFRQLDSSSQLAKANHGLPQRNVERKSKHNKMVSRTKQTGHPVVPSSHQPSPESFEYVSLSSDTESDDIELADKSSQNSKVESTRSKAQNIRSGPIIIDVDVDSNESLTITTPCEISDKYVGCNRKFDAVIEISPRHPHVQQTKQMPNEKAPVQSASKLRFTQISNYVSNKQNSKSIDTVSVEPVESSKTQERCSIIEILPTASDAETCVKAHSLSVRTSPKSLPNKSVKSLPTKLTKITAVSGSLDKAATEVRFYDYNNKYGNSYPQRPATVQRDALSIKEPNAKQNALAENDAQEQTNYQLEMLQKRSEERGRHALDREQVRRDCAQLTEKLEVLTRKLPEAPFSNDEALINRLPPKNPAKQEIRSSKALEDILLRPAVITCAERGLFKCNETMTKAQCKDTNVYAINVAGACVKNTTSSSDSCRSIVLGYDNNRTDQITIANSCARDQTVKLTKLEDLLERVNNLRQALLHALQNTTATSKKYNANKVENLINSINSLRQEHRKIVDTDIRNDCPIQFSDENCTNTIPVPSLSDGVVVKHQISKRKSSEPIEIVVKLKGKSKNGPRALHATNKTLKKSQCSKISPLIYQCAGKMGSKKTSAKGRKLKKGNSYDSSSTSYRSLPPTLSTKLNELQPTNATVCQPSSSRRQTSRSQQASSSSLRSAINPVIAHYVKRLLSMSRLSIQALGVSSSDVDTPTSSIINITSNCADIESVSSAFPNSAHRLLAVNKFIGDNQAFLEDLQNVLQQSKDKESLERKMMVEQCLQEKPAIATIPTCKAQNLTAKATSRISRPVARRTPLKVAGKRSYASKTTIISPKCVSAKRSSEQKNSSICSRNVEIPSKPLQPAQPCSVSHPSESQMARYEQLTVNCTNRITELTELIERVRQEKHRLLEVTATSISDNGRTSSEYLESSRGDKCKILHEATKSSCSPESMCIDLPIDKHGTIGHSLDSGISMTQQAAMAVDANIGNTDLPPITSTKSTTPILRKSRPPPTIQLFSPTGNNVVHELSTIIEVDTPANTCTQIINTSPAISIDISAEQMKSRPKSPKYFSTYESYLRDQKIDGTKLHSTPLHYQCQERGHPSPTNRMLSPTAGNVAHEVSTNNTPANSCVQIQASPLQSTVDISAEQLKSRPKSPECFATYEDYLRDQKMDCTKLHADPHHYKCRESGHPSSANRMLSPSADIAPELSTKNSSANSCIQMPPPESAVVDIAAQHKKSGLKSANRVRTPNLREPRIDYTKLHATPFHYKCQEREHLPLSPTAGNVAHEVSTNNTPANSCVQIQASSLQATVDISAEQLKSRPKSPECFATYEDYLRDQKMDFAPELSTKNSSTNSCIPRPPPNLREPRIEYTKLHADPNHYKCRRREHPPRTKRMLSLTADNVAPELSTKNTPANSCNQIQMPESTAESPTDVVEELLAEINFCYFTKHPERCEEKQNPSDERNEDGYDTESESSIDIEEELVRRKTLQRPLSTSDGGSSDKRSKVGSNSDEVPVFESHSTSGNNKNHHVTLAKQTIAVNKVISQTKPEQNRSLIRRTTLAPRKDNHVSPQLQHLPQHSNLNPGAVKGQEPGFREFLTKELLKHAQSQTSTSSSDDSMKCQILHTIADRLTPKIILPPEDAINYVNRGKMTSTPVVSTSTSNLEVYTDHSSIQLFSGESSLSAVHHHHQSGNRK